MGLDLGICRHILPSHLPLQLCPLKPEEFQQAQQDHSPQCLSIRAASVIACHLSVGYCTLSGRGHVYSAPNLAYKMSGNLFKGMRL